MGTGAGSTLRGQGPCATVAVVAKAALVCRGLPGCGRGASDGVGGCRFGDAGRLRLLAAAETREKTGFTAGGRCGSSSCGAVAGHCVLPRQYRSVRCLLLG